MSTPACRSRAGRRNIPTSRPGASANPVLGNVAHWFDPTAFVLPATGFIGTLPRNSIIGPDSEDGRPIAGKNVELGESGAAAPVRMLQSAEPRELRHAAAERVQHERHRPRRRRTHHDDLDQRAADSVGREVRLVGHVAGVGGTAGSLQSVIANRLHPIPTDSESRRLSTPPRSRRSS